MRHRFWSDGYRLHLSEVISALSYALDITEGQPKGHSARTCMLGMRLAQEIGLPMRERSALFYTLLLKDLGCSSTAPKVCYLFGTDERIIKRDLKMIDWTRLWDSTTYIARHVAPGGSFLSRVARFLAVAKDGQRGAKELIGLRCDRGASIARQLQLPEETAPAIRALDEHWDGRGYPQELKGEQIPLLGRILCIAQTVEVFWKGHGLDAALDMARQRKGTWFDRQLVEAFESIRNDAGFWHQMAAHDPAGQVCAFEPQDLTLPADGNRLDRIAEAFGQVIDAKSPWTHCHSAGVAEVSVGIGEVLGFAQPRLRNLRRAALLHDIGKLGVSNLILDKPGKLDADEMTKMRRHPEYTYQILRRVRGFGALTELAASHHERLDGNGYHRGRDATQLTLDMRVLAVADMYEALAARRPYRQDLSGDQVMDILTRQSGAGICPQVFDALKAWLAHSHFVPYQIAA